MLLGKRPRPPMKRTTSMSEITLDLNPTTDVSPVDPHRQGGLDQNQSQRALMAATASPRNHRRHSADFIHNTTTDFLRACSLCRRPLVPTRDIYMYRGDSAFCSLECRQQAMNQDERKEKCSLMASKKKAVPPSAGSSSPPMAKPLLLCNITVGPRMQGIS